MQIMDSRRLREKQVIYLSAIKICKKAHGKPDWKRDSDPWKSKTDEE